LVIPFLKPPAAVIVYLQAPRERVWGVVRHLDATGIVVQGLDLDSFDDWVRRVSQGGDGAQLSVVFFPLLRVEKVLVDAPRGDPHSLAGQFERRVGRPLLEFLEIEP